MTRKNAERQEAIARLHEWLNPGDTVYTILRRVSRSGMQREIGIVLIDPIAPTDGGVRDGHRMITHPNHAVATALGERLGKGDGVIVGGCGMDMGFHLVYNLGRTLWPDGFGCIGEACRSNDHSNGDRDRTPHTGILSPESRCPNCLDRPGKDGRGRPCVHCEGGYITHDHWHNDGGYALRHEWL